MGSPIYTSADWLTHREVKRRTITRPIDRDQDHLVITRTYRGPVTTYANVALNTVDSEFSNAYLVTNGPQVPVDGDEVEYTRIFSTVPANRSDYDSFGYTYPAFITGDGVEVRQNVTFSPTRRVESTYYLVGPGETYEDPSEIPTVTRQRYILTYYPAPLTPAYADVTFVRNADAFGVFTTPTLDEYTDDSFTELVAEDSHLEQYAGNIWRRYVGYIPRI